MLNLLVSWWFFCIALCKENWVGNSHLSAYISVCIFMSVQVASEYLASYSTSLCPVEFLLTEFSFWGFRGLAWCLWGKQLETDTSVLLNTCKKVSICFINGCSGYAVMFLEIFKCQIFFLSDQMINTFFHNCIQF